MKVQHLRERVGICGQEWHIVVVKKAIRPFGKYLQKLKRSKQGGFKELVSCPDATYLIDGVMNRQFFMLTGGHGEMRCQNGCDTDDGDDSWRHCIAVHKGRIRCAGVHNSGISAVNLHIDDEGTIDL